MLHNASINRVEYAKYGIRCSSKTFYQVFNISDVCMHEWQLKVWQKKILKELFYAAVGARVRGDFIIVQYEMFPAFVAMSKSEFRVD